MTVAKSIREAMTRGSWIRRMFEEANELRRVHGADSVFDFTLGNPVLEPPAAFFEALADLAGRRSEGLHRYMTNAGFPEVRAAIARMIEPDFPGITGEHVLMTAGAAGALNVALRAILEPGEEVILLVPYFGEYLFYVKHHGGVPVLCETAPDFDIDVGALAAAITPRTRAIVLNSPNNPTGRVYPRASLEAMGAMLAEREREIGHPVHVISDEPYREIVFEGGPPPSPAAFHRNSMQIYSWSKSLSIPGERIGYLAVNPRSEAPGELLDGLTFALRTLGFVNAPASMQLIVERLLALRPDVEWYRVRRDMLVSGLRDLGLDVPVPQGTFYLFPRSPEPDDLAFVRRALAERVLIVPGTGFGRPGHFRLSYTADERTVRGGLAAFARVMRG